METSADLLFKRLTDRIRDIICCVAFPQRGRAAGLDVQLDQSRLRLQVLNPRYQFLQRARQTGQRPAAICA